jgi:ELWxxDGT repeat protein
LGATSGGILYFAAFHGITGTELWKSDGTAAGTVLVKNIRPGFESSAPTNLTNINGKLYFSANDGVNGQELWSTDGTTAGTELVYDFTQDSSSSSPGPIFVVNNKLHVAAEVFPIGRELWVTDISPPVAGDYNGDRVVDLTDYNVWRDTFGSTTNLAADGNGDRVIDAADYVIWRSNYQSPTGHVPIGASPPRRAPSHHARRV